MKISELIAKLEELKKIHGDLIVHHAELGQVIEVKEVVITDLPEKTVLLYGS